MLFKKVIVWLEIGKDIDPTIYEASRELHENKREKRHVVRWRNSVF